MHQQLAFPNFDYLKFLQLAKDAGDKFPFAWKMILSLAQTSQDLFILMNPNTPVPAGAETTRLMLPKHDDFVAKLSRQPVDPVDAQVAALEKEVAASLQSHRQKLGATNDDALRAIGDGTLIRQFWAFLQANPQLLQWLLTLLGVNLPGVNSASGPAVQV